MESHQVRALEQEGREIDSPAADFHEKRHQLLQHVGTENISSLLQASFAINVELTPHRIRTAALKASCSLLRCRIAAILEFGNSEDQVIIRDSLGRETKHHPSTQAEQTVPGLAYIQKCVVTKRGVPLAETLLESFDTDPGQIDLGSEVYVVCAPVLTVAGKVVAVLEAIFDQEQSFETHSLLNLWTDQLSGALIRALEYETEIAASTEAWNARYERLKEATRKQLQQANDDADLLSEDNFRLQQELIHLQQQLQKFGLNKESSTVDTDVLKLPDELLVPGDPSRVIAQEVCHMDNLHGGSNILSVRFMPFEGDLVLTGGVDKKLLLTDWRQERTIASALLPSPVLSLEPNPVRVYKDLVIAACMDGSHHILRLPSNREAQEISILHSERQHTRQGAIRVRWAPDGQTFATCSVDKTASVYKVAEDDPELSSIGVSLVNKLYFNTGVEGLELFENDKGTLTLVLSLRDDNYLQFIDCKTFEIQRVNINQDRTDHVSFTMMDLRVSPNRKYLLIATDHNRHILFQLETGRILRNFYGHSADAYSLPRVLWDSTGKFVLSNSQKDNMVYIWCVVSERVVKKLPGHRAVVRDLDYTGPGSDGLPSYLATVSFDKSLRVWRSEQ